MGLPAMSRPSHSIVSSDLRRSHTSPKAMRPKGTGQMFLGSEAQVLHLQRPSFSAAATSLAVLDPPVKLEPKHRTPHDHRHPYAAIDVINYDHLNDNSAPWTMPYCCWKGEACNGFTSVAVGFLSPLSTFEANVETLLDDCFFKVM